MKKIYKNNLKQLRTQNNWIQNEIAVILSLQCTNRVSRWEQGSSLPNMINLFKLAKLFNVLPHELYPDLFNDQQSYADLALARRGDISHIDQQES